MEPGWPLARIIVHPATVWNSQHIIWVIRQPGDFTENAPIRLHFERQAQLNNSIHLIITDEKTLSLSPDMQAETTGLMSIRTERTMGGDRTKESGASKNALWRIQALAPRTHGSDGEAEPTLPHTALSSATHNICQRLALMKGTMPVDIFGKRIPPVGTGGDAWAGQAMYERYRAYITVGNTRN